MQTRFFNKFVKAIALSLSLIAAGAQAAPILQIENGELVGAKNITVAGKAYNVKFTDGTCNALYNNCTKFPFSLNEALGASAALFNQVFLDLGQGKEYDSQPMLTRGCEYLFECQVWTVFATTTSSISAIVTNNHRFQPGDIGIMSSTERSFNFASTNQTLAVWTPANAVPEPGSLALLGLAAAGLAFIRRKSGTAT